MQNTARRPKITVSDDGTGIVSHASALLLAETARISGLLPPGGHLRQVYRMAGASIQLLSARSARQW